MTQGHELARGLCLRFSHKGFALDDEGGLHERFLCRGLASYEFARGLFPRSVFPRVCTRICPCTHTWMDTVTRGLSQRFAGGFAQTQPGWLQWLGFSKT